VLVYTYVYMNVESHVCKIICIYANTCMCICMYVYMYLCMYLCMHACMHADLLYFCHVCVYVKPHFWRERTSFYNRSFECRPNFGFQDTTRHRRVNATPIPLLWRLRVFAGVADLCKLSVCVCVCVRECV